MDYISFKGIVVEEPYKLPQLNPRQEIIVKYTIYVEQIDKNNKELEGKNLECKVFGEDARIAYSRLQKGSRVGGYGAITVCMHKTSDGKIYLESAGCRVYMQIFFD